MRISQDVRDYAAAHGVSGEEAIELGMKEKAAEFVSSGAQVYVSAAKAARTTPPAGG
jgi:phosphomethylpyrimidine synthase